MSKVTFCGLLSILLSLLADNCVASTNVEIEFKSPFPKSIDLVKGDSLIFFARHPGDPGLYSPSMSGPFAKTVDGKTGDVLTADIPVKRLDQDNIQWRRFETQRAGEAQLDVLDPSGKAVAKIQVIVHPMTIGFNLSNAPPPQAVDLINGQRVSFISKDIIDVSFRSTDKLPGDLLVKETGRLVSLAPPWISLCVYQSQRSGIGELTITWYSQGKRVRSVLIPVFVK